MYNKYNKNIAETRDYSELIELSGFEPRTFRSRVSALNIIQIFCSHVKYFNQDESLKGLFSKFLSSCIQDVNFIFLKYIFLSDFLFSST